MLFCNGIQSFQYANRVSRSRPFGNILPKTRTTQNNSMELSCIRASNFVTVENICNTCAAMLQSDCRTSSEVTPMEMRAKLVFYEVFRRELGCFQSMFTRRPIAVGRICERMRRLCKQCLFFWIFAHIRNRSVAGDCRNQPIPVEARLRKDESF